MILSEEQKDVSRSRFSRRAYSPRAVLKLGVVPGKCRRHASSGIFCLRALIVSLVLAHIPLAIVVSKRAGRGLVREVGGIFVGKEEGQEGQAVEDDRLRQVQGGLLSLPEIQ